MGHFKSSGNRAQYFTKRTTMNGIITFEIGCRRCSNLQIVSKGTYICTERVHMDDSAVFPIVEGKRTCDWNICDGEYYSRNSLCNKAGGN